MRGHRQGARRAALAVVAAALLAAVPAAGARPIAVLPDGTSGLTLVGDDALVGHHEFLGRRTNRAERETTGRYEFRVTAIRRDGQRRIVARERYENTNAAGEGSVFSYRFRASGSHVALLSVESQFHAAGGDNLHEILAGPLGGDLTRHHHCTDESGEGGFPRVELDGTDLVFVNGCGSKRTLHVAAPVGSRPRVFDIGIGDFASVTLAAGGGALVVRDGPLHRVVDFRTGAVRGDLPVAEGRRIGSFGVDRDGTVAWIDEAADAACSGALQVLAPGAPVDAGVTRAEGICSLLAAGGGWALVTDGGGDAGATRVRAVPLAGPENGAVSLGEMPASAVALQLGEAAVASDRAAFLRSPCGGPLTLEELPLDGSETLRVIGDCPLRVRSSRVRAGRTGLVRVPIACANGCGARAQLRHGKRVFARGTIGAPPGGAAPATFRLSKPAQTMLRRRGRLSLRMRIAMRNPLTGRPATIDRKITVRR